MYRWESFWFRHRRRPVLLHLNGNVHVGRDCMRITCIGGRKRHRHVSFYDWSGEHKEQRAAGGRIPVCWRLCDYILQSVLSESGVWKAAADYGCGKHSGYLPSEEYREKCPGFLYYFQNGSVIWEWIPGNSSHSEQR